MDTLLFAVQEKALAKISAGLKGPIKLRVAKVFVDAPWAIVELYAEDAVAKAGWPFDNTYCWVMRFEQVLHLSCIRLLFVSPKMGRHKLFKISFPPL